MNDATATLEQLKQKIKKVTDDRDWGQFHTPKNLSMAIAAEAAELMEHFLWCESADSVSELKKKRLEVSYEIADVAILLLNFCQQYQIDLSNAIIEKLKEVERKYPVEKAKGIAKKYTEL